MGYGRAADVLIMNNPTDRNISGSASSVSTTLSIRWDTVHILCPPAGEGVYSRLYKPIRISTIGCQCGIEHSEDEARLSLTYCNRRALT